MSSRPPVDIFGRLKENSDFKTVLRMAEIVRENDRHNKAVLVSYPISEDERYETTTGGITKINLKNGTVQIPDGTQFKLNGSMDKVRSLLVFVSDPDAYIILDNNKFINDHTLWHLFEDIDIDSFHLVFPTGKVPDSHAFAFVACNKPNHSYKNSLFIAHDVRESSIVATTNNYVTTLLRHIAGYDSMVLTTKNTDGADSMTLKVSYSHNGVDWYDMSGYSGKAIASGVTDELDVSVKYHFIRAQVKSTVADTPADFEQNIQLAR